MRIGIGRSQRELQRESGGTNRFFHLLIKELSPKHTFVFNKNEYFDMFMDVNGGISLQEYNKIRARCIPIIYRPSVYGADEGFIDVVTKCQMSSFVVFPSDFYRTMIKEKCMCNKIYTIYNGVQRQDRIKKPSGIINVLLYSLPQHAWPRYYGKRDWEDIILPLAHRCKFNVFHVKDAHARSRLAFFNMLKQTHIFIHSSYLEPCSNALLEAMSFGCIPFTVNFGSYPEIFNLEELLVTVGPRKKHDTVFYHGHGNNLRPMEINKDEAEEKLLYVLKNIDFFQQYVYERIKSFYIDVIASKFDALFTEIQKECTK